MQSNEEQKGTVFTFVTTESISKGASPNRATNDPIFDESYSPIKSQKSNKISGSQSRRQVISKMITQQDQGSNESKVRISPNFRGSANQVLTQSVATAARGGAGFAPSPIVPKQRLTQKMDQISTKLDETKGGEGLINFKKIQPELSVEDNSSGEGGEKRISRCNSEILQQKYDAEEATVSLAVNNDDAAENPYEAIYDLSNKGNQGPGSKKQPLHQRRETNRSTGQASASSSRHNSRRPAKLKMINLENNQLSESSIRLGQSQPRRSESIKPKQKRTPHHSAYNVTSENNSRANNQAIQNPNQELIISKIQPDSTTLPKHHETSQMTFLNRQKTKLIHKNTSEYSQASNYDSNESKSITMHSGPDRSTTSHLNIKLPPMMGQKSSIKDNSQEQPASNKNNLADVIRVAPMDANEKESGIKPKIKPSIRGKGGSRSLQKSTTFSPRDPVMSKNGSVNNQLSERSNKKLQKVDEDPSALQANQSHAVRRMLTTKNSQVKTSQKIPIPLFSQTSPMNSIRQDSNKAVNEEDMVSVADAGGYKNFVIESSPKQPPKSKHEINKDEKTKEETRINQIPSEMPPAAVQRVSFGMQPLEMQMQELQNNFSLNEDQKRRSTDSQEALNYYLAQNIDETLGHRIYPATATIKPKVNNAAKPKKGNSKIKMYAIPQNIKLETHSLIERISSLDCLEVIFMKLWSLSNKAEDLIERYFAQKQGRTIFSDSIIKCTTAAQDNPTKQLTLRTAHHILASISLGILLVHSEVFHLHDNILLLSILSKNGEDSGNNGSPKDKQKRNPASHSGENLASEKPVCSFDQFKLILLSLFGEHLHYMRIDQIDATLRDSYKQITMSGEAVYEDHQQKNRDINVSKEDSLNQHFASKSGSYEKHQNQQLTMAHFGKVKELKLIQLSELIKMVQKQAQAENHPGFIDTMNCVLEKFHLACYKQIKYTDYRSAFTELQRQDIMDEQTSFKEQSLKKYQPANPWEHWTMPLPKHLRTKTFSFKAQNPLKIQQSNNERKQNVSRAAPKQAHRGRMQNFNFSRAQTGSKQQRNQQSTLQQQSNIVHPNIKQPCQTASTGQPDDAYSNRLNMAEKGMLVKLHSTDKEDQAK